jgi:hypothetical protein
VSGGYPGSRLQALAVVQPLYSTVVASVASPPMCGARQLRSGCHMLQEPFGLVGQLSVGS